MVKFTRRVSDLSEEDKKKWQEKVVSRALSGGEPYSEETIAQGLRETLMERRQEEANIPSNETEEALWWTKTKSTATETAKAPIRPILTTGVNMLSGISSLIEGQKYTREQVKQQVLQGMSAEEGKKMIDKLTREDAMESQKKLKKLWEQTKDSFLERKNDKDFLDFIRGNTKLTLNAFSYAASTANVGAENIFRAIISGGSKAMLSFVEKQKFASTDPDYVEKELAKSFQAQDRANFAEHLSTVMDELWQEKINQIIPASGVFDPNSEIYDPRFALIPEVADVVSDMALKIHAGNYVPGGSLAVFGLSAAADQYMHMRRKGYNHNESATVASATGAVEVTLEKIPLESISKVKKLSTNAVMKLSLGEKVMKAITHAAPEAVEEFLAGMMGGFREWDGVGDFNPYKQAVHEGFVGFLATLFLTGSSLVRTNKQQKKFKDSVVRMTGVSEQKATQMVTEFIESTTDVLTDPVISKEIAGAFDKNVQYLTVVNNLSNQGFKDFVEGAPILLGEEGGAGVLVKDIVTKIDPANNLSTAYIMDQVWKDSGLDPLNIEQLSALVEKAGIENINISKADMAKLIPEKMAQKEVADLLQDHTVKVEKIQRDVAKVKALTLKTTELLKESKLLKYFQAGNNKNLAELMSKMPEPIKQLYDSYELNKANTEKYGNAKDSINAVLSAKKSLESLSMLLRSLSARELYDAGALPNIAWNEDTDVKNMVKNIIKSYEDTLKNVDGDIGLTEDIYTTILQDVVDIRMEEEVAKREERVNQAKIRELVDSGLKEGEIEKQLAEDKAYFSENDQYSNKAEEFSREFMSIKEDTKEMLKNIYDINLDNLPSVVSDYIAINLYEQGWTKVWPKDWDVYAASLAYKKGELREMWNNFVNPSATDIEAKQVIDNIIQDAAKTKIYEFNKKKAESFFKKHFKEQKVNYDLLIENIEEKLDWKDIEKKFKASKSDNIQENFMNIIEIFRDVTKQIENTESEMDYTESKTLSMRQGPLSEAEILEAANISQRTITKEDAKKISVIINTDTELLKAGDKIDTGFRSNKKAIDSFLSKFYRTIKDNQGVLKFWNFANGALHMLNEIEHPGIVRKRGYKTEIVSDLDKNNTKKGNFWWENIGRPYSENKKTGLADNNFLTNYVNALKQIQPTAEGSMWLARLYDLVEGPGFYSTLQNAIGNINIFLTGSEDAKKLQTDKADALGLNQSELLKIDNEGNFHILYEAEAKDTTIEQDLTKAAIRFYGASLLQKQYIHIADGETKEGDFVKVNIEMALKAFLDGKIEGVKIDLEKEGVPVKTNIDNLQEIQAFNKKVNSIKKTQRIIVREALAISEDPDGKLANINKAKEKDITILSSDKSTIEGLINLELEGYWENIKEALSEAEKKAKPKKEPAILDIAKPIGTPTIEKYEGVKFSKEKESIKKSFKHANQVMLYSDALSPERTVVNIFASLENVFDKITDSYGGDTKTYFDLIKELRNQIKREEFKLGLEFLNIKGIYNNAVIESYVKNADALDIALANYKKGVENKDPDLREKARKQANQVVEDLGIMAKGKLELAKALARMKYANVDILGMSLKIPVISKALSTPIRMLKGMGMPDSVTSSLKAAIREVRRREVDILIKSNQIKANILALGKEYVKNGEKVSKIYEIEDPVKRNNELKKFVKAQIKDTKKAKKVYNEFLGYFDFIKANMDKIYEDNKSLYAKLNPLMSEQEVNRVVRYRKRYLPHIETSDSVELNIEKAIKQDYEGKKSVAEIMNRMLFARTKSEGKALPFDQAFNYANRVSNKFVNYSPFIALHNDMLAYYNAIDDTNSKVALLSYKQHLDNLIGLTSRQQLMLRSVTETLKTNPYLKKLIGYEIKVKDLATGKVHSDWKTRKGFEWLDKGEPTIRALKNFAYTKVLFANVALSSLDVVVGSIKLPGMLTGKKVVNRYAFAAYAIAQTLQQMLTDGAMSIALMTGMDTKGYETLKTRLIKEGIMQNNMVRYISEADANEGTGKIWADKAFTALNFLQEISETYKRGAAYNAGLIAGFGKAKAADMASDTMFTFGMEQQPLLAQKNPITSMWYVFAGYGTQEGNQILGWGQQTFSKIAEEFKSNKPLKEKLKAIASAPDQELFYFIVNLFAVALAFSWDKGNFDFSKGWKRAVDLGMGGVETMTVKQMKYFYKYVKEGRMRDASLKAGEVLIPSPIKINWALINNLVSEGVGPGIEKSAKGFAAYKNFTLLSQLMSNKDKIILKNWEGKPTDILDRQQAWDRVIWNMQAWEKLRAEDLWTNLEDGRNSYQKKRRSMQRFIRKELRLNGEITEDAERRLLQMADDHNARWLPIVNSAYEEFQNSPNLRLRERVSTQRTGIIIDYSDLKNWVKSVREESRYLK